MTNSRTREGKEAAVGIVRRRLANQYLAAQGPKKASDVVRALGAVQAQDYAGAKWALAQRTRGATDAEIERELSDGSILRTHVLRPTWHFVAPADIRWMLALTAPRVNAAMAYYDRILELDAAVFRRSNAALTKALAGGKHLTRAELGKVLAKTGIGVTSGQRLGHLMMRAELDAVVCSGPRRGRQFTYALLDERVPPTAPLERDEALLELTRRYFTTREPATARDFAWWSGLSTLDVKRGIHLAGAELEQTTLGGQDFLVAGRSMPKSSPTAHLLPNYDEYFIGYKDRSAIGQRLGHAKAVTGGNALIAHVVFVDGQLVGGWKRIVEKNSVVIELDLLARLTAAEQSRVEAAGRKLGNFLERPVKLRGKDPGPSVQRRT
jgi:winged helix DNA-binding protein